MMPADEEARREGAARWVTTLADGPLAIEQQVELELWFESDVHNRETFRELAALWNATGHLGAMTDIAGIRDDALAALARTADGRRRWFGWVRVAAIAACLMILIGGAFFALHGRDAVYRTATGERRVVTLPDGSHLQLDSASEVAVDYTSERRALRLVSGRAKFDVAKDPRRPFTVTARGRSVIATGTTFSVEIIQSQLEVVLYEGSVSVLEDGPDDQPPRHVGLTSTQAPADLALSPGNALIVSLDRPVAAIVPVDAARSLAWETGRIIFTDEPLAAAVERMNRYSTQKIAIADPSTARLRVSGAFDAGDVAGFIDGVTTLYHLRQSRERDALMLRRDPAAR